MRREKFINMKPRRKKEKEKVYIAYMYICEELSKYYNASPKNMKIKLVSPFQMFVFVSEEGNAQEKSEKKKCSDDG